MALPRIASSPHQFVSYFMLVMLVMTGSGCARIFYGNPDETIVVTSQPDGAIATFRDAPVPITLQNYAEFPPTATGDKVGVTVTPGELPNPAAIDRVEAHVAFEQGTYVAVTLEKEGYKPLLIPLKLEDRGLCRFMAWVDYEISFSLFMWMFDRNLTCLEWDPTRIHGELQPEQ